MSSSQAVWGSGPTEECTPALSHRAPSLAKSGSNLGPIDMEYSQRVLLTDLGNEIWESKEIITLLNIFSGMFVLCNLESLLDSYVAVRMVVFFEMV